MNRLFRTARRPLLIVASIVCGSLLLASPANAVCNLAISNDDGTAELSHDHDFIDDKSVKYLYLGQTPIVATGASLYMQGSSYGGCGEYLLLVNGSPDHTFYGCGAWQVQPVNPLLLTSGLNSFEVTDTDGTWDTGLNFGVDTSRSGSSVMIANGIAKTGELIWVLSVSAVLCI